MTGNWREEHLFVLAQALAMYDDFARHLSECDVKLQALLLELSLCPCTEISGGKVLSVKTK